MGSDLLRDVFRDIDACDAHYRNYTPRDSACEPCPLRVEVVQDVSLRAGIVLNVVVLPSLTLEAVVE